MRFSTALIVFSIAGLTSAQHCFENKGTCKYTSECHAPAYYHKAGLCPGPKKYQCCIPSGCVVCARAEARDSDARDLNARDLNARIPCC
ncbi:hypothetical protein DFH09DRAFT_1317916 [Mycena vulgaris]|nr:hypothetical protein DFH09DRAFT_1317916 [Mycena vulgaris]